MRVVLNTAWIPLTPERLLEDLFARSQWLESLTPDWSPEKRSLLRRERGSQFSVSDVPLLDEAAELLGYVDSSNAAEKHERKQQRKRDVENAEQAIRNMDVEGLIDAESLADGFQVAVERGSTADLAAADRTWAYGHIVVDEAQELSPMQWRLLKRRSPQKSFTIVGDVAQASAAASAHSWAEALAPIVGDDWRLEELTVNYRTPAQIAEAAELMAVAHGLTVTRSQSVRSSQWPVAIRNVGAGADSAAISAVVLELIAEDRAIDSTGTVAVIASGAVIDELFSRLDAELGDVVGRGAAGLSRAVAVLTPQESKGLEFDATIVVGPQRIVDEIVRGAAALYVAMTRPTQRLHIVAEGAVPEGIR